MYLLRLLYQRHRRAVPRLATVLMLGLAALAIGLPAPRMAEALDAQPQPMVLTMRVTQSSWISQSLSELTTRDRLESKEFGTLAFGPAPQPI